MHFDTAEGLIAGKTPVLCRSVPVGTVIGSNWPTTTKAWRSPSTMTRNATRLLVDDTQIWVVRARYSSAGISGFEHARHRQLRRTPVRRFQESAPSFHRPGKSARHTARRPRSRFKLIAAQAGGLSAGASIVYKGISVGKLETRVFHPETGEVEFTAFIADEYVRLVDERTRFYNSGGLDLKVGADGIQLRSATIESLLSSSVTFTEPRPKSCAANRSPTASVSSSTAASATRTRSSSTRVCPTSCSLPAACAG